MKQILWLKKIFRLLHAVSHRRPLWFWSVVTALALLLVGGIAGGIVLLHDDTIEAQYRSWSEIEASDTLRAVAVASSTTAFEYKGQIVGHEYEKAQQVAKGLGLQLDVIFAPDERSLLDSLYLGQADIALQSLSHRWLNHSLDYLRPCGYRYEVQRVLIGNHRSVVEPNTRKKTNGEETPHRLCVVDSSAFWYMLGEVESRDVLSPSMYPMVSVADDSVTLEDLVDWVVEGLYDCTIVDENLAQYYKTYFPKLQVGQPLEGFQDTVSWVVSIFSDTLAQKVDSLCLHSLSAPRYPTIVKRYYEQSQGRDVPIRYLMGGGRLSVYDDLYRQYAAEIGWDWRLMAAISFVESRFDPLAESSVGARGLMQLMPTTAVRFGCPEELLADPESNVRAGSRLLSYLQEVMQNKLVRVMTQYQVDGYAHADSLLRRRADEQYLYYTIGGFHAGVGHIFDAISLADTLGYQPTVWQEHASHCLTLKKDSLYYTLPCVQSGPFAGDVTVAYVEEVLQTYEHFKTLVDR